MREQFEKLPHILELMQYVVCFDGLKYVSENQRTADYLNGAWYAFQEQQKIINMQDCGATEIMMILEDSKYDDSVKLERISELLK